jgi:hypothetical protein
MAVALVAHAALVFADESASEYRPLVLHGFGTLGAVYHNTPGIEYRRDISQPGSGAKAGQVSFAQDSMLAVQADYRRDSELSGVVQIVSRLNAENSFIPQVSLANLKYEIGYSQVRVGRMNIETYLEGDAAEIGYANPMVRQPTIHYPRALDGLAAETTQPLGEGLLRLQGQAGWGIGKLVSNGPVHDASGAETLEAGADYSIAGWTTRISAGQQIYNTQTESLQPGSVFMSTLAVLPNGAELYNKFNLQGRKFANRMLTVGYDREAIQGQAGYAVYLSPHISIQKNYYVRGAYRLGEFTPYVSYLRRWTPRTFIGTGIADGLSVQTDALNLAISNGEAAMQANQSEFVLGVRYDFMANRALKLQWERIRFQDSYNLIDSRTTNSRAESRGFMAMSLFSIALDFVF